MAHKVMEAGIKFNSTQRGASTPQGDGCLRVFQESSNEMYQRTTDQGKRLFAICGR